ncbi:MAG: hypothetical protein B7Z73_05355, partial [Planctomycetia bacterium 21-64-5]
AATATATGTASVADADTLTAGTPVTATTTEGATFSGTVAAFTDGGYPGNPAGDFTATITWGDGTSATTGTVATVAGTPGAFVVSGTHVFSDETAGSPVSITVSDAGGSPVTLTGTALVHDAALTPAALTFDAVAGTTFTGKVATFTDANPGATASDFTATITWGDGSSTTAGNVTAAAGAGFVVSGSHLYTQASTRSVTVVINDGGGAAAAATSTAIFADLVVSSSAVAIAPVEGAGVSGAVATFRGSQPGGTAADFTASVLWGDGATTTAAISGTAAGGYTVSGSHTYAEEGTAVPLAIIVSDQLGNPTTIANTTNVADATLAATAVAITGAEGATLSGTVATFTDADPAGAVGDYTVTINWGDNTSTTGVVTTEAGGGFAVEGSHAYAEEGTFTYTVTINDAGGAKATVSAVAVVSDAPLAGTGASVAKGATVSGTVASFSDPDTADTTADYTATINWGDGTTADATIAAGAAAGQFNVLGGHTYSDANPHTITVTVTHGTDQPLVIQTAEPGNPVPFLVTEHSYTIGSGTVTVSASNGLLTGDTGPSQLMVTAGTVTGADGGSFAINADGSFTYTPGANFPGYDNAQFTVTDTSGDKGTATVNVLSQHAGVVWKFYESVLNRVPDPAGLQYWTNYFNSGGNTGDMAFGFFESDELLDKVLGNYYEQYLLRPLDAGGLTYWKGIWHATGGPEQIKAGFADSPEFYKSAGGTPDAWIDALYQRILDRTPDASGKAYWLNYYQQQTAAGVAAGTIRYNIALGFFDSAEAFANDVTGWFQEYLFRAPTDAEKAQYVSQMEAGATDRTIEQEITNLPEYASNPAAPAAGTGTPLADYYQTAAQSQAVVAAKDALFASL